MEPTKAILTIEKLDAEPIDFVTLEIDQCFYDHHRVKIALDLKKMGEDVLSSPMQKTSLINEKIQIDIQEGEDAANAYGFIGIITDVQISLDAGDHGLLYIYAASPTILLERGKMLQTYSITSLSKIFKEVTSGATLNRTNNPKYKGDIKFSMQYKESDFQYLKRISWMYGEKLFFSGDSLVFGEPEEKSVVKITYDKELKEVTLGSRLIPNTFKQYINDMDNKKNPYEPKLKESGTFAGEASARSDKLNDGKKPDMPLDVPVSDQEGLKYISEMRKKRNVTNMFYVTGKTKLYKVRIGGLLEIDFHDKMNADEKPGTLRVIKVCHTFDERGKYSNHFEAVPSTHGFVPCPDVDIPYAHTIPATVIGNVDPDGLGKIQVKFDFEDKDCEHWIPIMTPEAGGGQDNRGFLFIPECGDKILTSFFEGNPEFPFVLGSMFHAGSGKRQGGGKGNHIKSIRDKSGSEVVLNDKDGSVKLFSSKGNSTVLVDGQGNVSISTPKTITLSAKDININASNSINLSAKPAKEGGGEGTIDMTAKKTIDITAETENISVNATAESILIEANTEIKTKSSNITIEGTDKTSIEGKNQTKIKSDSLLDMDGGALSSLKSTLVKINS